MADSVAVGAEAPNFDLASTENAVLMLCDEVPRMAVLLYFFADPGSERVRADLAALRQSQASLTARRAVVLAVSPAKLPALMEIQKELDLRFPLLHDDRDFTARYGIEAPSEGPAEPAMFLVDRDQRIVWLERPLSSVEGALGEVTGLLEKQPAPTYHYPSSVVNRVVNWWVNKIRPRTA